MMQTLREVIGSRRSRSTLQYQLHLPPVSPVIGRI